MTTTPTAVTEDPTLWRRRAEEARRTAARVFDVCDKNTLIDIADAYEQLARLAEQKFRIREQYRLAKGRC